MTAWPAATLITGFMLMLQLSPSMACSRFSSTGPTSSTRATPVPVLRASSLRCTAGVEVGPMRRNVEAAGFGGDQGVFVVLCGGQRACRVELAEVIFGTRFQYMARYRHSGEIRQPTEQRTAPSRFGQHLCSRQLRTETACRAISALRSGYPRASAAGHPSRREPVESPRAGQGNCARLAGSSDG